MPPPGGSGEPMAFSQKETRKALALRLGILSDLEISRLSVVDIYNEQLVDRYRNPMPHGVHDPRMGTMDRQIPCATCGCSYIECPGHFGSIALPQPVYHPGYINYIIKILRCICSDCGKLRADHLRTGNTGTTTAERERERIRKTHGGQQRFKKVYDICSQIKVCEQNSSTGQGCGRPQPTYRKNQLSIDKIENFVQTHGGEVQGDTRQTFRPEDAREILEKISDADLRLMGLDPKQSRPEWMVIKVLSVAPPPVRPSVEAGDGVRSEDDLTYAYREIIKMSKELKNRMDSGQPRGTQDEVLKALQLLVATLMDNNMADCPQQRHTGGRPLKDIRSRLKGKEGRVRGNLMGKRVDFSARTVITPDPILQLDQLGVPKLIAMNLTVPEHVTHENIHLMRQLVNNGPTKWPGAKWIIRHDGRPIDLSHRKSQRDIDLAPGYIVERQLRDGDYVIFNRQPSLHKMSLMGHRVKVLPFQTFRLNLSVTSPYNADFDGDEMNMHVPQNFETMAEIKEIMAVPLQIISPKHNSPVMGIVQDSLLGIFLFTHRDTFIEKDVLMNLMMWIEYTGEIPTPAILKPKPLWTGKQVLSLVIPRVNFSRKGTDWDCRKDSNVLIKDGQLLCGVMNKSVVGSAGGGLVHIVWRDQGPYACRDFMSHLQNIVNQWLQYNGFTVGVQDIIATPETLAKIRVNLKNRKKQVRQIIRNARRGKLETIPGKGMLDSFEFSVNSKLAAALDEAGKAALEDLVPWNRLKNMVNAGSKGGDFNISQIMACVGQQNVSGCRITFGFARRSLPHFSKDDYGPESKGFVSSCYVGGLTPTEFYFHAMGGREGLVDTAVKTADTGYIQRRLIKALEDVQVKYDATVRTSRDTVIQFLYGEDGMNPELIEKMSVPLLNMNNSKMQKEYQFFQSDAMIKQKREKLAENLEEEQVRSMDDQEIERISKLLEGEFEALRQGRDDLRSKVLKTTDNTIYLPINLNRLIWNAREKFQVQVNHSKTDLTPQYVVERVNQLVENKIKVYPDRRLNNHLSIDANKDATMLAKIFIRSVINAKSMIQNGRTRLTRESFDWLLGEVQERFERSLVHPGEMVGSIGAQAIGESVTQMTLNTFHSAGVGTKNVTLGVPRLKEIINVATTIKTPSLRIFLKEEFCENETEVHRVGNEIEHTTLSQIVANSAIYYDPNPESTIIQADEDLLEEFNRFSGMQQQQELSPWLIRFEIDADKMRGKGLNMDKIEKIIKSGLGDEEAQEFLNIVRHSDAQLLPKMVFRIRLQGLEGEGEDTIPMRLRHVESVLLNDLALKGIKQITKYSCAKLMRAQEDQLVVDGRTGDMTAKKDHYIIETDGVELKGVMSHEKVDHTIITSNSVREILTVLGVEAARLSLIKEIRMVLNFYGIYINYRHLSTLCDIMTNKGTLTAITRHGINRIDSGALRKCSFEETVEILLEAALHGEIDPLSGITENIIMGQLSPYGTGCFDLMVDADLIKTQATTSYHLQQKHQVGEEDLYGIIEDEGERTPLVMSPEAPLDGGQTSAWGGGQTPFGSFTPGLSGADSEYTPTSPTNLDPYMQPMACPASPIKNLMAGSSPYPTQGGMGQGGNAQSVYSLSSPAYPKPSYMGGYGARSPAYNATSPAYQAGGVGISGTTPAYAPYSPARFGLPGAGGTTPAYTGGMMGGAAPYGMSPSRGMGVGYPGISSPMYSPTGNPAYSPTQGNYGAMYDEPNYNQSGGYDGQKRQNGQNNSSK